VHPAHEPEVLTGRVDLGQRAADTVAQVGAHGMIGAGPQSGGNLGRPGEIAAVGAHQRQVGNECVPHRDMTVVGRQRFGSTDHVRMKAQQPVDRVVVHRNGLGGTRHRIAVLVVED
jgi:hypothetical protein